MEVHPYSLTLKVLTMDFTDAAALVPSYIRFPFIYAKIARIRLASTFTKPGHWLCSLHTQL